jgi:large subunit ribosomal protein L10
MPNPKKERIVERLAEIVGTNQVAILTDYRGLRHSQMTELRRRCSEAGAKYAVVKNRLLRLALAQHKRPDPGEMLLGPTAVAFAPEDPQPAAKLLADYAKESKLPHFKGALVGDDVLSQEDITAISKLPGREILVGQLVGAVQSPLQALVGTLNEILAGLARTVQAIADKAPAA